MGRRVMFRTECREMRSHGASYIQIAAQYPLHINTIMRHCRGIKCPVDHHVKLRKHSAEKVREWIDLQRQGKTYKQIAAMYGTTKGAVGGAFHREKMEVVREIV